MTLAMLLDSRLDIRRNAPASPSAVDEWNQPAYTGDTTIATVPALVQPLSIREVALLTDAGAQIGDFRAFMDAYRVATDGTRAVTDVRSTDRLRNAATGVTYEVRSVLPIPPVDVANQPHHLELILRRVVD